MNMKKLFKKNGVKERTIGDFTLGATLGVGGYAKVKLGIHRQTGQKVALKLLFADKTGKISDSKKKQLDRAVDLLTKVDHKNVLKLMALEKSAYYPEANGTQTQCMMMALEHAGNGELFDYLMFTGYFDEVIARSYFHQLIDGLDAIHKMGFAHRDLKPENLLLDRHFTLKIADFGFATAFRTEDDKEVKMKTACGTKGYLAPEVLKGLKYEQSVDIFAAGIILFITYAGFPPFNDAIPTDWWWNRLDNGWKERAAGNLFDKKKEWSKHGLFWAAHERTRKFPIDLKDFLLKLLHPNPSERPTIEEIRNQKWEFYQFPEQLFGAKEKSVRKARGPSWYQKETKPANELGEYLEKRRAVVRKERAKKIRQQQEQMSTKQAKVHRADHPEEVFDPTKEKWFDFKMRTYYTGNVARIDPNNEFSEYMEDFCDGTFASTPFYFFTKYDPALVAACFEEWCIRTKKPKYEPKCDIHPRETKAIVRAATETDSPLEAEFEVKQYKYDDDKFIVACKRLRGDPLAYKSIMDNVWEAEEIVQLMCDENENKA